MNARTSYVLMAILAVGMFSTSSAFAQEGGIGFDELACPDCAGVDVKKLGRNLPIEVWTDQDTYDHNSIIMVEGQVANVRVATPVTLTVISPINNIVSVSQLNVEPNGMFSTSLSTAGSLWKYDGTYTIRAQYGNVEVNSKALIELVDGERLDLATPKTTSCRTNEIAAGTNCVPYTISGGSITSASFSGNTNSLTLKISSSGEGTLTVNPSTESIRGIFMVLVDGEEWDDVEINKNSVKVMFPDGTEKIEIIGTFAVPEFGVITALVLAVAIISIIAISAKTKLGIMPKY